VTVENLSREELLAYRGLARFEVEQPDGTVSVLYNPTPRQDAFHLTEVPNALFGGAAGGGKSHCLRWDAYMRCISQPGYRALLLRRTYPELADTHIERVIQEVAQFKALGIAVEFQKSEFKLRFFHPNGEQSVLQFGHCEDDSTVSKYLSTEYDAIYFDEASTFEERHYLWISSRARGTKPGVKAIVRCGSNPGGIGALWLKRRYIDKDITFDEDEAYAPEDYEFIPSKLTDNPYLGDDYRKRLLALPSAALRRAYLYGEWDVFEGQEFSEWKQALPDGTPWHVIDELPTIDGKPITEVNWLEHFRSVDWGYSVDNGVCLWWCCLPDGRYIIYKEFVFKGMIPKRVAQTIVEMSRGLKIRYTVADPSMWMKGGATGESIQETFGRYKVGCIQADNDHINGWQRVHHLLTESGGYPEQPLLQIYRAGCPYLIRTLPMMCSDPKRPGDIKSKAVEDHGADALRYGAMSRPAPTIRREPKRPILPGTVAWEVRRILKKQRSRGKLGAESMRRR
jgi:phage terminase large subunit